ncbi:chitin deacetylase [Pseudocyphellaria aurata]|nr:chitin deacetylase [Pseudocyphellaria aurata]
MQWTVLSLAVGLAMTGSTCAFPFDDLQSRALVGALTPDNSCGNVANGNGKGYLCDANSETGGCCSQYGFCGKTSDYCGAGCQVDFGTCGNLMPKSAFQCGPTFGNQVCDGGLCCSGSGYCGNTTDYCGATCQNGFGDCTTKLVGDGDTCGPQFGDTRCPANTCCSPEGYCGTTKEYCGDPDCQYKYGTCDSDTTPAGKSTLSDPRPILGQVPYNTDINDCIENNVVALTYDDGPFAYTSQLLDTLKSYGFHATFFVTGNNNGKGPVDTTAPYPDLLRRMVAEGHQIASHTWSHYSLDEISSDLRKQQMVKNERAIANIIREISNLHATALFPADMQALGYHRVYFDLDTTDYLNPLPDMIQKAKDVVKAALADNSHDDYLSIQHDIVEQSVSNLSPYYFNLIKGKGWKGVTVGECLQDPQQNWYRTPA